MRALVCGVLVGVSLAACGGDDEAVTLYLEQRLGADGPRGQAAPVLEPVGREPREGMGAAAQALVQLRQGPTPDERARGFRDTVSPRTRLRLERIERGTAYVAVAGEPLDFAGVAALVYSLTESPEIVRVRACCLFRHDGSRIWVHTRRSFTGWRGEPCALRHQHRCLRDD